MAAWVFDDGGRMAAGFKGGTGDCVARAVAIASGRPYSEVYARLAEGNKAQRKTSRASKASGKRTAAEGINVTRKWFRDYMTELGFLWVATMGIGTGCTVHVSSDELPGGRLILALSKHYAAFVDGVLRDTYDSSRHGTRCVYGYYIQRSTGAR